jgi:hypothetical protein
MLMDKRTEFLVAAAVPTAVGLGLPVGGQIPLGTARDVGGGDSGKLTCVIQVTQAFTSAGAATVEFVVASDSVAAIAVDGTASEHVKSKAFAVTELTLGTEIHLDLPSESSAEPYELFLGILTRVGVAVLTAGAVNAFLTRDAGNWKAYPAPGQA